MNDNKLIFSLVIGVVVLFGLFMLLTGEEQEPVTLILTNEVEREELLPPSSPNITDDIVEEPPIEIEEGHYRA